MGPDLEGGGRRRASADRRWRWPSGSARQSPSALAAIKQAVHAAASRTLDEALDHERDAQRALGYGEDFAEGVAAFLEKRPPKFGGR